MEIYLDSADLKEIEEAVSFGVVIGVTTNPTLLSKNNESLKVVVKKVAQIFKKNKIKKYTLSLEVTDIGSSEEIIKQARKLSKLDEHVVVKVPLTVEGIEAVRKLEKSKIRCNVTLCFSSNQALLAAKAGAFLVSPFIGRIDDEGYDGLEVVSDIKRVYENYGYKTKILAASIRSVNHVRNCALMGVDVVTVPFEILKKMYYNPLTNIGIEKFANDWEKYQKKMKGM